MFAKINKNNVFLLLIANLQLNLMSLFKLLKNSKKASMICVKDDQTDKYDCKMGFDTESKLFKDDKFEHKQSFCSSEFTSLVESLGAIDTKDVMDVKRWVTMDAKSNIDIYSFGGSSEVHIVKIPATK